MSKCIGILASREEPATAGWSAVGRLVVDGDVVNGQDLRR